MKTIPVSMFMFCALATLTVPALAQDAQHSGFSGVVGIGAASAPTYEGSPDDRVMPFPLISLAYDSGRLGTFELGQAGLSWNFLDVANLRMGVLVGSSMGRKDEEKNGGAFTQGDDRLQGMGNIKSTGEAGAMLGYGPVTVVARKAIGNNGHDGMVADIRFDWGMQLTSKLGISAGASARYADSHYMQTYFGVTSAQAAASSFAQYTPEAGFTSGEVAIGANYAFTSHWGIQAGASFKRLLDDAKASPLALEPNGVSGFVALAWMFD